MDRELTNAEMAARGLPGRSPVQPFEELDWYPEVIGGKSGNETRHDASSGLASVETPALGTCGERRTPRVDLGKLPARKHGPSDDSPLRTAEEIAPRQGHAKLRARGNRGLAKARAVLGGGAA